MNTQCKRTTVISLYCSGGKYMKFDCATLFKISKAPMRNHSPTDELLTLWGEQNHTILELFTILYGMQHYQAMNVLKPFGMYSSDQCFSTFFFYSHTLEYSSPPRIINLIQSISCKYEISLIKEIKKYNICLF